MNLGKLNIDTKYLYFSTWRVNEGYLCATKHRKLRIRIPLLRIDYIKYWDWYWTEGDGWKRYNRKKFGKKSISPYKKEYPVTPNEAIRELEDEVTSKVGKSLEKVAFFGKTGK